MNTHPANQLIIPASQGLYVKNETGNWDKKWSGEMYDALINPANTSTIYAVGRREGKKFMVIVSTDSGATFKPMEGFPTTIDIETGAVMSMSPENTNVLYVLMLTPNKTPLLYTGTWANNAWTWELTNTGGSNNFPMGNGQGYYDLVLEAHVSNHKVLYAGTTTLFRSNDGGKTFSVIGGYWGDFETHPDFQYIKSLPKDSIWVATDGGMILSVDNFATAEGFQVKNQGLMGSDFWGFDQGWNEDLIVGGRYHNGNTALADYYNDKAIALGGGESATGWIIHGKERHAAFDDIGPKVLPKSIHHVMPTEQFSFGKYPNMDSNGDHSSNLVSHPVNFNTIYVGQGSSLWQSDTYGAKFSILHTFPSKVRYFQVSMTNPKIMYLDVFSHGLYRSDDGGITWIQKPSLTSSAGSDTWKGNLFFCISPNDPQVIYATCNQHYPAKVFKSIDGGDTWTSWTDDLPANATAKHVMIQPDENGNDLVYITLTANRSFATNAAVYYRKADANTWVNFSNNMPPGLEIRFAKPFYRDSKIRLGTNCGVWESPMTVKSFRPVIIPWVESSQWDCVDDTLHFEDHSILNHQGASWKWSITPAPKYIDDANKRNPKVVVGNVGSYSVTLTVTVNGIAYSKHIEKFITAKACPTYPACNNLGLIPKTAWRVTADSQELNGEGIINGRASAAIDGKYKTYWHTQWQSQSPPYPHYLKVDLGDQYQLSKIYLYPRKGSENGDIKDYSITFSESSSDVGSTIAAGALERSKGRKNLDITTTIAGRYLTLHALSSQNGKNFAGLAEIEIKGCLAATIKLPTSKLSTPKSSASEPSTSFESLNTNVQAYPIPVQSQLNIELPFANQNERETVAYCITSIDGKSIQKGNVLMDHARCIFDLGSLPQGIYVMKVTSDKGQQATIKIVKK